MSATPFHFAEQDPVRIDPQHHELEYENERVRVLRIGFGPHEKSVMHYQPRSVAVLLTDCDFSFGLPGGKQAMLGRAGQVVCFDEAFENLPENLSAKPFEAILVELKQSG
jgi:hypothetical protein